MNKVRQTLQAARLIIVDLHFKNLKDTFLLRPDEVEFVDNDLEALKENEVYGYISGYITGEDLPRSVVHPLRNLACCIYRFVPVEER